MALNRGKEFEGLFKKATKDLQKSGFPVDIQRLYDVIGKKTIDQPADFVCYYYPNEIYVECKSTNDTSFSYYNQPQYERLIEKSNIKGTIAGMFVWYIKYKRVFWFDIRWLQGFYASTGVKSLSMSRINTYLDAGIKGIFEVDQVTKRINPELNVEMFFNKLVEDENG